MGFCSRFIHSTVPLCVPLINTCYRIWCSTLRITEQGREVVDALHSQCKPMVFSLWHNELFALIHVRRKLRVVTVVSRNRDAEYLARLLNSLGLKTVRGSTSRGGAAALRNAWRLMDEERYNCCITVDGPRGPRHVVKQGALALAIKTQAYIVPVRIFSKKAKVFRSWDRFRLPLPFSRVHVFFGEPYKAGTDGIMRETLPRERDILQKKLNAMVIPEWKKIACPNLWRRLKASFLRRLSNILGRLSEKNLARLADWVAFLFWHGMKERRHESIHAMRKHLHLSEDEARALARKSFKQSFRSFLEMFHSGQFRTDRDAQVVYSAETKALLQSETAPIVIATAHLGSWELMPGLASDLLPNREGMVIVRRQRDPELNTLIAAMRGARGMLVIDHRRASSVVLPKLRNGGVAAFLVDHNSNRRESVFLPFLEDVAAVNTGPAILALRTKATVFPVFLVRNPNGQGRILHIMHPLKTTDLQGSIQEKIEQVARFYTDAVAEMVRLYPDQWFWMHKRWKTREFDEAEDRSPLK